MSLSTLSRAVLTPRSLTKGVFKHFSGDRLRAVVTWPGAACWGGPSHGAPRGTGSAIWNQTETVKARD